MTEYDFAGLELTGDTYTVEQALLRNKYKAVDEDGNTVLKGKKKMLKLKEEFPFTDADGNAVMTAKAGGILDVAADYMVVDDQTGEEIVMLDNQYSFTHHKWTVRDPDTEAIIARIESESTFVMILKQFSNLASIIPHSYKIEDAEGNRVGTISGAFSIKDKYEIDLSGLTAEHPREVIIASAMIIDAIENN